MKLVIEASTIEEISLLTGAISRAIVPCSQCYHTPQKADGEVRQTVTEDGITEVSPIAAETPDTTPKAKRGRPRKAETTVVTEETTVVEPTTETSAVDVTPANALPLEELRAIVVKKADESPEMQGKVLSLVMEYSDSGKVNGIPDSKQVEFLERLNAIT